MGCELSKILKFHFKQNATAAMTPWRLFSPIYCTGIFFCEEETASSQFFIRGEHGLLLALKKAYDERHEEVVATEEVE